MTDKPYFLKSGQIYVSSSGEIIQTVLGSCIAVCLFDHKKKIGGMNHFLLAMCKTANPFQAPGKYGNLAIPELVRRIERQDGSAKNLVAKIVGGASILSVSNHNHVPEDNIKGARQILTELSIPIVGQDIGGRQGRKVLFNSSTGQVTINESRII